MTRMVVSARVPEDASPFGDPGTLSNWAARHDSRARLRETGLICRSSRRSPTLEICVRGTSILQTTRLGSGRPATEVD